MMVVGQLQFNQLQKRSLKKVRLRRDLNYYYTIGSRLWKQLLKSLV